MIYLHCPRCRLAIACRADYLMLTNCPRCLARAAIAAPLFTSPLNGAELHAAQPRRRRPRNSCTRPGVRSGADGR